MPFLGILTQILWGRMESIEDGLGTAVSDDPRGIVIGVDTHKQAHVAVALDELGMRLGAFQAAATNDGYAALLAWARAQGRIVAFAVEGTGSYGVGLARYLRRHDVRVTEVGGVDRRKRHRTGKDDTIDAEQAARAQLAGTATAVPKTADGLAEMVRQLKIARDSAVKARSAAVIALKTLLVNAPADLRETLEPLTDAPLLARCARLVAGDLRTPAASSRHALRALARRCAHLSAEITTHDTALDALTAEAVPSLRGAFGIGADVAAEMRIVAGDNPDRIRSEAAFAKLLWRMSHSRVERNDPSTSAFPRGPSAGERSTPSRCPRASSMAPTHRGLRRPANRGRPFETGYSALFEAIHRAGDLSCAAR